MKKKWFSAVSIKDFSGAFCLQGILCEKGQRKTPGIGDEWPETRRPNCLSPCVFRRRLAKLVTGVVGRNGFAHAGFAGSIGVAGLHG